MPDPNRDTSPPPELFNKELSDVSWPPSAPEMAVTFATAAGEIYLRWPACEGKAIIQTYGADGTRLRLNSPAARKGAATVSNLSEVRG